MNKFSLLLVFALIGLGTAGLKDSFKEKLEEAKSKVKDSGIFDKLQGKGQIKLIYKINVLYNKLLDKGLQSKLFKAAELLEGPELLLLQQILDKNHGSLEEFVDEVKEKIPSLKSSLENKSLKEKIMGKFNQLKTKFKEEAHKVGDKVKSAAAKAKDKFDELKQKFKNSVKSKEE